MLDGTLPEPTVILGVARNEMTPTRSPSTSRQVVEFSRQQGGARGVGQVREHARLRRRRVRQRQAVPRAQGRSSRRAKARARKGNRMFYLSTPPAVFPMILQKLQQHGLIERAVQKPARRPAA